MRMSVLRAASLASAAAAAAAIAIGIGVAVPAHASGNPLARLTADQIASKAITNLKTTASVRLTGSGKYQGQSFTMSMTLTPKGCDGTMGLPHQGTFVLLVIGKNAWMQPSDQFWQSAGVTGSELPLVSGKYIAVTGSEGKQLIGGLDAFCTPKDFAHDFAGPVTGLIKGSTTSIGGQPALKLKDTGDSAFLDISVSAKPEVLRVDDPGTANFSFSHYGAKVTLSPPPADEVIKLPS